MIIFFHKFFERYPNLTHHDFYLVGESYAGHYIPAIARAISHDSSFPVTLKGVAIGNGLVDPLNQATSYSDFAYAMKLINRETFDTARSFEEKCIQQITQRDWEAASETCSRSMSIILKAAGDINVRRKKSY